jgi:hypothetical protein
MLDFRFKRALLENPLQLSAPFSTDAVMRFVIEASEALHVLKGQLDRMPEHPLVNELANFLHSNWEAEKWRSSQFVGPFDNYAKQIAVLSQI